MKILNRVLGIFWGLVGAAIIFLANALLFLPRFIRACQEFLQSEPFRWLTSIGLPPGQYFGFLPGDLWTYQTTYMPILLGVGMLTMFLGGAMFKRYSLGRFLATIVHLLALVAFLTVLLIMARSGVWPALLHYLGSSQVYLYLVLVLFLGANVGIVWALNSQAMQRVYADSFPEQKRRCRKCRLVLDENNRCWYCDPPEMARLRLLREPTPRPGQERSVYTVGIYRSIQGPPAIRVQLPDGGLIRAGTAGDGVVIGRAVLVQERPERLVTISLPSPHISRNHARIFYHQADFFIEDLESKAGTFVNGEQITAPRQLADGDRVKMADWEFVCEIVPMKS